MYSKQIKLSLVALAVAVLIILRGLGIVSFSFDRNWSIVIVCSVLALVLYILSSNGIRGPKD